MQFGFLDILQLIGSLVLFLFAMRMMSEALQKSAGGKLRNILRKMTHNHFTGITSGFFLTSLIQSSSASTVMFVSFVNAGLISFAESISLILGANIGTTITAWLVAILGFKFDIATLCLPFIALGFPLIFSRKHKLRNWGEVIIGFSLLFLALNFLKSTIPDINNNPHLLEFLANYNTTGFSSILLFLFVGLVITLVIQSSSATLALIVVMCGEGWIGFELASAMVIGVNIGTTITANIAAIVARIEAKKSAFTHTIINIVGAIVTLIIFSHLVNLCDWITTQIDSKSALTNHSAIPIGLAVFHSLFNIITVTTIIGFINPLVKIINKIFPTDKSKEIGLRYINTGLLGTSELSLLEAKKEIQNFASQAEGMYRLAKKMYRTTDSHDISKLFNVIENREDSMDKHEIDIANYLAKVSENELSLNSAKQIRALMKINDNIESIADNTYNLARLIHKKSQQKTWFTPELRQAVNDMFDLLNKAFVQMNNNIENSRLGKNIIIKNAYEIEEDINSFRTYLKQENMQNIKKKEYRYQAGVTFLDMISICENIGDHLINISEALLDASND